MGAISAWYIPARLSACQKQKLPAFKVGSDWRFAVKALDHWIVEAERRVLREGR
jgi:hypothetical protein